MQQPKEIQQYILQAKVNKIDFMEAMAHWHMHVVVVHWFWLGGL